MHATEVLCPSGSTISAVRPPLTSASSNLGTVVVPFRTIFSSTRVYRARSARKLFPVFLLLELGFVRASPSSSTVGIRAPLPLLFSDMLYLLASGSCSSRR